MNKNKENQIKINNLAMSLLLYQIFIYVDYPIKTDLVYGIHCKCLFDDCGLFLQQYFRVVELNLNIFEFAS